MNYTKQWKKRASNKLISLVFLMYAIDENIEKWVIFRHKYRKSAFILHLYSYI